MPTATPRNHLALYSAISAPRLRPYLAAALENRADAIELYGWNAQAAASAAAEKRPAGGATGM